MQKTQKFFSYLPSFSSISLLYLTHSFFAPLSTLIGAAADWYPGLLHQHQPWRFHWLCKVCIRRLCCEDTASFVCLCFLVFFFVTKFKTQVLEWRCKLQGPRRAGSCSLSIHPMLNSVPLVGVSLPQFTSLVSLKLKLMSWSGIACIPGSSFGSQCPHCFRYSTTEMYSTGGPSTVLLMHILGAAIHVKQFCSE